MDYKRILIKISGEVLSGGQEGGWDTNTIKNIASKIKDAKLKYPNLQIAVVVGAGNLARGGQLGEIGINRVDGDQVGMLGTVMNSIVIADIFNSCDLDSRALSAISIPSAVDDYTPRRAANHLRKGRVVILGGGTSRPFMTTDTAAVLASLELSCQAVFKATKVDGIYSADPAKDATATKFASLKLSEALELPDVKVMDKAALGMASEMQMPIVVFKLDAENSVSLALEHNADICTVVS
jgi:uridylate kinase